MANVIVKKEQVDVVNLLLPAQALSGGAHTHAKASRSVINHMHKSTF